MRDNYQKIRETLIRATFEVFEKTFYIFLEHADANPNGHELEAVITFAGAGEGAAKGGGLRGEMRLLFSKGIARQMVLNMLGPEGGKVKDAAVEDCAREAANIVCGNFLGRLDPGAPFDLSLPRLGPGGDRAERGAGGSGVTLSFESDGGRLSVGLALNG